MKSRREDIQKHIREVFPTISTQDDLLTLINYIHNELYVPYYANLKKRVPHISVKTFNYYKNIKLSSDVRYKTFSIPKKSGKPRIISAPASGLKMIQECLNIIFQAFYSPNEYACGFVPNRNVSDGAKKHTNQPYVYNIDLKDFFDTITFPRVKAVLALPPFDLKDAREPIAYIIACLCCNPKEVTVIDADGQETKEVRNCLPQGASTSPILTNMVCRTLDRRLAGLAKRYNARYSRYADDITFSCIYNIFKKDSDFIKELYRIVEEDQNLRINAAKTRLQTASQRQEVTGLIVNRKVNVTKEYVKQVRQWLYYWEHYGLVRAQKFFLSKYKKSNPIKKGQPSIENVLAGKLDYMRMIVGEANPAYRKLTERYVALTGPVKVKTKKQRLQQEPVLRKKHKVQKVNPEVEQNIGKLLDDILANI